MRVRLLRALAAVALGAGAVAGCTALDAPTAPARAPLGTGPRLATAADRVEHKLLECPTGATRTVSGVVGPAGGTFTIGNTRVVMPSGAVPVTQTFEISVRESRFVEIEAHAVGFSHYVFDRPITITIDYARCSSAPKSVTAWYIDSETKALLEYMGGVTDQVAGTHTFQTTHLSGYAVAD